RQGVPFLSKWMLTQGVSPDLQQYYAKSGWLESIGHGAYKKFSDEVSWLGAVYALQSQAHLNIHVGALTALSLYGREHYLRFGESASYTFSTNLRKLPSWFVKHPWDNKSIHLCTKFLPTTVGITNYAEGHFDVQVSSLERAFLEYLYLAPTSISYVECYQIFEGLGNLRPDLLQQLLENCRSVRVKRLFLYMSQKMEHSWLPFLDVSGITLGKGTRSLEKGGVYVPEFNLMIPKDLFDL
ncbi:MAG: type IV toxin-antitoxin system AbiEi family antitoxin, partial [Simkaniaceae bacterium]|nr:type IV toxin-antitoxin system AbiEi family antitoxin [Simkaniaceae bacterium]